MIVSLVVLGCVQGVIIGLYSADLVARYKDREAREEMLKALSDSQTGLRDLHNKNVETLKTLTDKVNAHSMALAGGLRLK